MKLMERIFARNNEQLEQKIIEAIKDGNNYAFDIARAIGRHVTLITVVLAKMEAKNMIVSSWAPSGHRWYELT